jgi:hypothetical protein
MTHFSLFNVFAVWVYMLKQNLLIDCRTVDSSRSMPVGIQLSEEVFKQKMSFSLRLRSSQQLKKEDLLNSNESVLERWFFRRLTV